MAKKTIKKRAKIKLVEIARSFKYPVSMGQYMGTADIFCSYKAECAEKDAEKTSEAIYAFCKTQVIKDVNAFKAELRGEKETEKKKIEPTPQYLPRRDMSNYYEKKDNKQNIREGVMMDDAGNEF